MTFIEFTEAVASDVEKHVGNATHVDDLVWTLGLHEAELRASGDREALLLLGSLNPTEPLSAQQKIRVARYGLDEQHVGEVSLAIQHHLVAV